MTRTMAPNLTPTSSITPPTVTETGRSPAVVAPAGTFPGGDPAREYLQFVFGVLRRRMLFLACFVAAISAMALVIVNGIKPLYQAQTQLILEAPGGKSLPSGLQSLLSAGGGGDLAAGGGDTDVALLTSLTLAERVVAKLDLANMPYFTGEAAKPSALGGIVHMVTNWLSEQVPGLEQTGAASAGTAPASVLNRVYDRYFRNLTVRSDRARVIEIRFVADSPTLASAIANTLAEIYIADQIDGRRQSTSRETGMLDQRVEELRARINEAQQRLEDFRVKHGILDLSGGTVLQRQLTEYNQQLMAAQLRRSELESRARQLQDLAQSAGGVDGSSAMLEAPGVQRLREQETAAARHVAELSALYRDDHPKLQQARAELNDIRTKIGDEIRRVISATANQARLAREQEATLTAKLNELNQQVEQQVVADSSLRLLQVDLKTNTELYEMLLNRLREARAVEQGIEASPVRVISRALPPDLSFYPNKPLLVGASAVLAALIGILLAFVLEFLDVGFRNRHQIEALTGLETVASIPKVTRLGLARRLSDMRSVLRNHPGFAEAIRYVRVSLSLAPDDTRPVRSILVTSTLPNEGKTFVSRALAVTYAMGGKRVITVDCDLRQKPRSRRRNDPGSRPGLADFLGGSATLESVIGADPTTGLHHIDCGDTSSLTDAPILLESPRMRHLLRGLAEKYDMVILDTPPVRLFPDTLVIQHEVDKVLFLVRWAKTRREAALDALKTIVQSGRLDPVVGLTQIDLKQAHRFDYASRLPRRAGDEYPTHREAA